MDPLHEWGLNLITAIQQAYSPGLDGFFRAVTFLGEEEFYLLFLPLLLWCVDFGLGVRLALFFLLSSYLNTGLKDLLQQPRPFHLVPAVQLADAEGYGLPSGHAQSAVVVWGSIAAWVRRRWFWVAAVGLMGLIGTSRVYLGVHFPSDVLAGWAIGAVLLVLYLILQRRIEAWLVELGPGRQLVLALAVPAVLLLVHPVKDTTTTLGTLAGAGIGLVLLHRRVAFHAGGPWWQRGLRFLVGGIVVVVLYVGLKVVFPGEGSALYLPFRLLRYAVIGLWATLGGPWLFIRLRLA